MKHFTTRTIHLRGRKKIEKWKGYERNIEEEKKKHHHREMQMKKEMAENNSFSYSLKIFLASTTMNHLENHSLKPNKLKLNEKLFSTKRKRK